MRISGFSPYLYHGNIADFVAPPMDMIGKEEALRLSSREDNVASIMFNSNPSRQLGRLRKEGKLKKVGVDMMLILKQDFVLDGENVSRTGLICSLELDSENDLIPHEGTMREYVIKRRDFLAATGAQVEPVFIVAPGNVEEFISTLVEKEEPLLSFVDSAGVVNTLYPVKQGTAISRISEALRDVRGIIADGHHRVKALIEVNRYRERMGLGRIPLLSYITSLDAPGLRISGIHRIIRGGGKELLGMINSEFSTVEIQEDGRDGRMILYDGSFREMEPLPETRDLVRSLGLYPDTPPDYSHLILSGESHNIVSMENLVEYTPFETEAIREVNRGGATAAILMPRWSKDKFLSVVSSGRILPPKSTFFHPKIFSGIALSLHESQDTERSTNRE
ncbi:MAG: DUF1015 family protein [Thermoplasmata archaeon]